MSAIFLEVSFRHGKPFAAYLRLPRLPGAAVARTIEAEPGILADLDAQGAVLGVEIVSPSPESGAAVRRVLATLQGPVVPESEFKPLLAA